MLVIKLWWKYLLAVSLGTFLIWSITRSAIAQMYRPTPLTVIYTNTTFHKGQVTSKQTQLAVRSDGSRVEPRFVQAPDGKIYEQKVVVDMRIGKRILVEG